MGAVPVGIPNFLIPASLVGRSDASRLIRELDMLDNEVRTQRIRGQNVEASSASNVLVELAEMNKIDLKDDKHRQLLVDSLRRIKIKSPIIHVTFAEHAHPEFMQQIVAWVRQELHPGALIHVGLQPGIVAGCIVRTPSHIFDFSIQHVLKAKRPILNKYLQVQ